MISRQNLPERPVQIHREIHHAPLPVQPDDLRWPGEGAEHGHDPPVLQQVGDRLHAAADQIDRVHPRAGNDDDEAKQEGGRSFHEGAFGNLRVFVR